MNYLIIAILYLICLRLKIKILQWLFFFLSFYYFKKRKLHRKAILLWIFLFGRIVFTFYPQNESDRGVIIEQKVNYSIADFNGMKVMVYGEVFKGDEIKRTSDFSMISSLSNFHSFDFFSYCQRRGMEKVLYDHDYEIVHQKNSLQKALYQKVMSQTGKKKEVLLQILYQQDTKNMTYLLFSSGIHFSTINAFIFKFFNKKRFSFWFSQMLLILFGFLFGFQFSLQRILIQNSLYFLSSFSSKDRLGLEMILLMFLYPYCVYDASFLFPMLYRFFSSFNISYFPSWLFSSFLLTWLQLFMNGCCHLTEIFLFSFYRKINVIFFILACCSLLIPFLHLELLSFCMEALASIPKFTLNGQPSFMLTFLFLSSFIHLLSHLDKKTLLFCGGCLILIPLQAYISPFYEVVFINVGQGDCILIQAPFHQANVLIDIPSRMNQDVALEIVVPYLKSKGIFHLDALILTHKDMDHSGGKESLMNLIPVHQVIEQAKDLHLKGIEMKSLNTLQSEDENEASLVYYTKIGSLTYLFLADVPQTVENDLIEKYQFDCDVLKVAHHGSNTSTSPYLIQNISPQLAIISVGAKNRYGHPHRETLDTLSRYHVSTFLTSEHGAISIKSLFNFNFITTSQTEFGIIMAEREK